MTSDVMITYAMLDVSDGNHSDAASALNNTYYSLTHMLVTTTILGILILLTIVGNVFVIAAIVLEKNLHSVANYLIASLAVADLMVAALVMPLAAFNETRTRWMLGRDVCDMWVFFDVLCCTSSILHLMAIALDRYWAVTRVTYIKNRSARRILMMIALSWIISICISLPPLLGWEDEKDSDLLLGKCLISQDWGYTVFSTVGAFYLPSFIMIIIYIRIYQVAKTSIRKRRFRNNRVPPPTAATTTTTTAAVDQPVEHTTVCRTEADSGTLSDAGGSSGHAANGGGNMSTKTNGSLSCNNNPVSSPPLSPSSCHKGDEHKSSLLDITKSYFERKRATPPPKQRTKEKLEQKRERKAARTLSIITGTFICSWMPFFVVAIVRPFCGSACTWPDLLMSVIGWLGYINSFLNPIIYTIFSPDFRLAFRKILFGKYKGRARAHNGR